MSPEFADVEVAEWIQSTGKQQLAMKAADQGAPLVTRLLADRVVEPVLLLTSSVSVYLYFRLMREYRLKKIVVIVLGFVTDTGFSVLTNGAVVFSATFFIAGASVSLARLLLGLPFS